MRKNLLHIYLSLMFDEKINHKITKFSEKCNYILKVNFYTFNVIVLYAMTIVFRGSPLDDYIVLFPATRIFCNRKILLFLIQIMGFVVYSFLGYITIVHLYIVLYIILYVGIIVKIYSNFLRHTFEQKNSGQQDIDFQKVTKWRLVFLIQRNLELYK